MAEHARFEKLVAEAKKNITEVSPQDAAAKLKGGEAVISSMFVRGTSGTRNTFPARCT
jgi:hypothetical protein